MPPGITIFPVASTTRPTSPVSAPGSATATIFSPCTATSQRPTPHGATTRPPRTTRSSTESGLLDRPVLVGEADDHEAEEAVGDEPERAQTHDPDEDLVRGHPQPRVEDQIAEPGVRGDHLGRDHG